MSSFPGLSLREGENLLVGIDPGKQTGVCFVSADNNQVRNIWTSDFWTVYQTFQRLASEPLNFHRRCQIYMEQPGLIKSLYNRHAEELIKYRSKQTTRDKIVWDGGGNAREAVLLAQGLRSLNYRVIDVEPDKRRKWNREDFRRFMGWTEKSNQHVRDAAFLVWGVKWKNA